MAVSRRTVGAFVRRPWLWAALLPPLVDVALLALDGRGRLWFGLTPSATGQLAAYRLIVEAALVVVVAPLLGVHVATRRSRASVGSGNGAVLAVLVTSAAVLAASSALLTAAVAGSAFGPIESNLVSHATLWAGAVALGAFGALCAAALRDPLDAGLLAVCATLAVSAGVIVAGPAVAAAPMRAINGALLASPLVATAAAASIDIFRTPALYRLSPIAHLDFQYPVWEQAFALYCGAALVCFVLMTKLRNVTL